MVVTDGKMQKLVTADRQMNRLFPQPATLRG